METEREIKYASILQEARLRYPIGTEYIGLDCEGNSTNYHEFSDHDCQIVFEDSDGIGIDCGVGYVYAKGKWAEKVEVSNYEIF